MLQGNEIYFRVVVVAPPARARTDYDYLVELLLVDDKGLGKSYVLQRFIDDFLTASFIITNGIGFKIRIVELDVKMHEITDMGLWGKV